jgi:hypothetical protein
MMFGDIDSPVRPLMSFWFLVICPGMAFVRLLHISNLLIEITLAVALSFALDAILATVMVYAGMWSPEWGLAMLLVISLGGALVQLLTDCRRSFSTMRNA